MTQTNTKIITMTWEAAESFPLDGVEFSAIHQRYPASLGYRWESISSGLFQKGGKFGLTAEKACKTEFCHLLIGVKIDSRTLQCGLSPIPSSDTVERVLELASEFIAPKPAPIGFCYRGVFFQEINSSWNQSEIITCFTLEDVVDAIERQDREALSEYFGD